MCGIAGIWLPAGQNQTSSQQLAVNMARKIAHRGPDGAGSWVDHAQGVALSHCRLAIVDLSPSGAQPMVSRCGRFVLTFNGEIYNYRELRQSFSESIPWRGTSDTEVLLELICRDGFLGALEQAVGMFAFAIWDRKEERLLLARDRCGEKPLYYGNASGCFIFCSELNALGALPGWRPELNREAVADLLSVGCIPAPASIYQGIFKLPPATWCEVKRTGGDISASEPKRYWFIDEAMQHREFDAPAATSALEETIVRAIAQQMVADVEVGAFLSGGIDSTLIVALMQSLAPGRVSTFTIGFDDTAYDETSFARQVAEHLGTRHHERIVTDVELRDVIPKLPTIYSEPFADASQIPTYLVAKFAKERVKVALSGDGGDELFGGYNRHIKAHHLAAARRVLPVWVRATLANCLQGSHGARLGEFAGSVGGMLPAIARLQLSDKMHKLGRALACDNAARTYEALVSSDGLQAHAWNQQVAQIFSDASRSDAEAMMIADFLGYLPDDILVKVDRAAMANSLETRAPFLDHRVVMQAFRLPLREKLSAGMGKLPLRRMLEARVPAEMLNRPKSGFAVPLADWLRGPLRDWADALLLQQNAADETLIKVRWNEHLLGRRNWKDWLWPVLMLTAWQQHQNSEKRV